MAFYPGANTAVVGNSGGSYTGGPYKGLLHTTESTTASSAISAFTNNNSWPHFLIDYAGAVWQFINTNVAARALRNLSGGIQTNRDSVIQIEIVGFAAKPNDHPQIQMDELRELMRWIEATTGVKQKGPGRPFASAYGQNHLRFNNAEWEAFDGWCGHAHCPENNHWDPGMINIDYLLSSATPPPSPVFAVAPQAVTVTRAQGGYMVVQGSDGGVFSYDGAPFFGSLPGAGVTAKVLDAAWTPTGNGYWLLGIDGAIFSFGDAQYFGGFNALPANVKGNRVPVGIVSKNSGYIIVAFDNSGDGSPYDFYGFGT